MINVRTTTYSFDAHPVVKVYTFRWRWLADLFAGFVGFVDAITPAWSYTEAEVLP